MQKVMLSDNQGLVSELSGRLLNGFFPSPDGQVMFLGKMLTKFTLHTW